MQFHKVRRANRIAILTFLVGCPAAGFVFGNVFFMILNLATGPYQPVAEDLSIILWTAAGAGAGVYSAWAFWRAGEDLQADIDAIQPAGLVAVLLDREAPFGDRHDAAMDLANYDEPEALEALNSVKNDPDEDADIVEEVEQSLLEIYRRRNES
tara:strand:- start:107 stop:568 length:462 start_codon:yes stop_codon:yes gene_type:complete